jgi:hypothetical protein
LMKNSSSIGTPLLYPIYICQSFGESNHITSHHSLLVKESKKHRRKKCVCRKSIHSTVPREAALGKRDGGGDPSRTASRRCRTEPPGRGQLSPGSCRPCPAFESSDVQELGTSVCALQVANLHRSMVVTSHATRRFQKKSRNGRNST